MKIDTLINNWCKTRQTIFTELHGNASNQINTVTYRSMINLILISISRVYKKVQAKTQD